MVLWTVLILILALCFTAFGLHPDLSTNVLISNRYQFDPAFNGTFTSLNDTNLYRDQQDAPVDENYPHSFDVAFNIGSEVSSQPLGLYYMAFNPPPGVAMFQASWDPEEWWATWVEILFWAPNITDPATLNFALDNNGYNVTISKSIEQDKWSLMLPDNVQHPFTALWNRPVNLVLSFHPFAFVNAYANNMKFVENVSTISPHFTLQYTVRSADNILFMNMKAIRTHTQIDDHVSPSLTPILQPPPTPSEPIVIRLFSTTPSTQIFLSQHFTQSKYGSSPQQAILSLCTELLEFYDVTLTSNQPLTDCSQPFQLELFEPFTIAFKNLVRNQVTFTIGLYNEQDGVQSLPGLINFNIQTIAESTIKVTAGAFTSIPLDWVPSALNLLPSSNAVKFNLTKFSTANPPHTISTTLKSNIAFETWTNHSLSFSLGPNAAPIVGNVLQSAYLSFSVIYPDQSSIQMDLEVNFIYQDLKPTIIYLQDYVFESEQLNLQQLISPLQTLYVQVLEHGKVTNDFLLPTNDLLLFKVVSLFDASSTPSTGYLSESFPLSFIPDPQGSESSFTFQVVRVNSQGEKFPLTQAVNITIYPTLKISTGDQEATNPDRVVLKLNGFLSPTQLYTIQCHDSSFADTLPSFTPLAETSQPEPTQPNLTPFNTTQAFSYLDTMYILNNLYSTNPSPILALEVSQYPDKTFSAFSIIQRRTSPINTKINTTLILILSLVFGTIFVVGLIAIGCAICTCINRHKEYKIKQVQLQQMEYFDRHVQHLAVITAKEVDQPDSIKSEGTTNVTSINTQSSHTYEESALSTTQS